MIQKGSRPAANWAASGTLQGTKPATLVISPQASHVKPVIEFCTFNSVTDSKPKPQTMTVEAFVERLRSHKRLARKEDGELLSTVVYKPGTTRGNDNVKYVTALAFDIDHGDMQAITGGLRKSGYHCCVDSTYSSTPEAPRFRVILFLARNVYPLEFNEIWARANAHFFNEEACDGAKDRAHMFYEPSCPPDGHPFAFEIPGRPLDPDELPPISKGKFEEPGDNRLPLDLNDGELIERMTRAKPKAARLWAGDTSDYASDESRADEGLCFYLTWWANHDMDRVDRLFRQSGLYRDKWERDDYRQLTLDKADQIVEGGYTGKPGEVPEFQDTTSRAENVLSDNDAKHLALVARIEQLEALVRDLQRQLRDKQEDWLKLLAVQRNGAIKQERNTGLAVVFAAKSAESRGDLDERGFFKVSRYAIAELTGQSTKTVSTHTDRLAEWDILDKQVRWGNKPVTNPETGEIIDRPRELWVRLKASVPETLDRLACIKPEPKPGKASWGGTRTPRCPEHPEADIIETTTWTCAVCKRHVCPPEKRRLERDSKLQDDTYDDQAVNDTSASLFSTVDITYKGNDYTYEENGSNSHRKIQDVSMDTYCQDCGQLLEDGEAIQCEDCRQERLDGGAE